MQGNTVDGAYNTNIGAFDKKVIYIYKHLDVASHHGWLKVGETKASRIKGDGRNMRIEEQNSAANVAYEVLYTTDAVTNSGKPFSDTDIHELLVAKDIEREETLNPNTNRKSEWFKTDLQTIIDTIEKYKLEAIEDVHGKIIDFSLRDEQKAAVTKTKEYFENCQANLDIEPSFLWNAKPRFGKTLTAYCFASEIRAEKVLIVTNRPAIADSWYTDFCKFDFADENQTDGKFRWIFTSSDAVRKRLGSPTGVVTRSEQLLSPFLTAKNTIHFISLQDIKGKDSIGFKEKNKWIFDLGWDLVVIDESHEGVDTSKAMRVFDSVKTKFTLHLSGTPFKALAGNKFNSRQIYNWSYTDEQSAKENWPILDGPNPYAELPKMHIYTYQLSRILETTAEEAKDEGSEYAFDLNEFFRITTIGGEEKFAHEDKVKLFIQNLRNPNFQYPFSSLENRDSLRHTFWLLPGVKACKQLKKLLLEDEYFGANYAPEDIIDASAAGDDDRKANTALEEVRNRIGKVGSGKHPLETRTITLSCGQLTTGVTVPAWTAVLMLNNCKSPSLYMQSAFRAQNPFKIVTSGGECYMKENCYVFDFAPDRILQTLAEIADSGVSKYPSKTREEKVKILINFLPVIAEDDEGKMKYLDANEVLTIPLKLITEEVLNRGFMSNRLFENISGIFGCPQDIKDIIAKMDEAKGNSVEKNGKTPIKPKVKIWVGEDNKIHINEDIVVATTNGLFGDKKYVEIGSEEGKEVQNTMDEVVFQARNNGYDVESIRSIQKAIKNKMPALVAKIPDPEPKPGEEGYVEKEKPDDKPNPKEKTDEEKTRDRLRGFARTIPSFLMAYGTTDTKLSNFGDNIPDAIFEELTNITKEDFRKLRDGCDFEVTDEDGNRKMAHFNGFFNEDVFNSSIQAFEAKQKELACYYKTDSTEDIFEYIPPQANNQIFTPKRVVRMMVDMLEQENPGIFNSTTNTFIDLYMKSGMYITEIVRRIFDQTRDQYPSDIACVTHILENQVYGFAPTPILDAITKNYIFGFDPGLVISQKNFIEFDATESAKSGTLKQVINQFFMSQGGDMKFTAVIGNPPYHYETGRRKIPLYQNFVKTGSSTSITDKACFVTPDGFIKGGPQLESFRSYLLENNHLSKIVFHQDSIFPEHSVKAAITLFNNSKKVDFVVKEIFFDDGRYEKTILDWSCRDVVRDELKEIIAKIFIKSFEKFRYKTMDGVVTSTKQSGLSSQYFRDKKHDFANTYDGNHPFRVLMNEGGNDFYYVSQKASEDSCDMKINFTEYYYVGFWKVAFPKAVVSVDKKPIQTYILSPNDISSNKYIAILTNDEQEAVNAQKYLATKFLRAGLSSVMTSWNLSKKWFKNIPLQDFTNNSDIDWSKSIPEIDRQLYKKYGLDEKEIAFIEEKVAPME